METEKNDIKKQELNQLIQLGLNMKQTRKLF